MFGIGMLVTAVFTVLTPIVARYSVNLFIALRVIEGIGEVCSIYIPIIPLKFTLLLDSPIDLSV